MCRSVANQTHFVQTVVCNFIDRANDFLDAGFIRPGKATCTVLSLVIKKPRRSSSPISGESINVYYLAGQQGIK
jgi:hypothetical protein